MPRILPLPNTSTQVDATVVIVDAAGNIIRPSSGNADGSQNLGGTNGTARATATNPIPAAVNGANGTGIATAANPFPVRSAGSATIATSQVTVGTTSTQIVAARTGRMSVTITNNGTNAFYVGITGLTTANGYLVPGVLGASVTIPTQAAVFGIAAVAQSVSVLETF